MLHAINFPGCSSRGGKNFRSTQYRDRAKSCWRRTSGFQKGEHHSRFKGSKWGDLYSSIFQRERMRNKISRGQNISKRGLTAQNLFPFAFRGQRLRSQRGMERVSNPNPRSGARTNLFHMGRRKESPPLLGRDLNPLASIVGANRRNQGRRRIQDTMCLELFHNKLRLGNDMKRWTLLKQVVTSPTEGTNFVQPLISDRNAEMTRGGRDR